MCAPQKLFNDYVPHVASANQFNHMYNIWYTDICNALNKVIYVGNVALGCYGNYENFFCIFVFGLNKPLSDQSTYFCFLSIKK